VDPAVYQAYLRGRAQYERWDSPSIHRALASYDRALAMDSTYAPAHAARAQALQLLSNTADTLALARASLERALALDPNLSEAHASLAQMLFYNDWKWAEAGREFKRAIELNPNNSDAHHQYAHWLMAQGRVAESVEQSRIGLRLDPLSPSVIAHMAWTSYMTGRFEDVPAYVRQALEIDPSYSSAQDDLVMTELARRRWPEWEDALRRAQQLGEPVDSLSYAVARAARAGRHDEALRLVQAMESPKDSVPHLPTELAAMYLALGRPDDAFAALERGLAQRSFDVIYVGTDPAFKELRSDPRMMALRRRMGLAS
jgi:serine/threonine-protein kinase